MFNASRQSFSELGYKEFMKHQLPVRIMR